MNYLFKSTALGFLLFISMASSAQDLVRKIPANALAVVTIKGDNLTALMPVSEFNNTFFGKKIQEKQSKKNNQSNSIEDLGFNISSSFYYYNLATDSITYHCLLAPVKNAAQVDVLYTQPDRTFSLAGKTRTYYNADSTEISIWNENMLLFVKGDGRNAYFLKPEVRKRLGLRAQTSIGITDSVMTDTAVNMADYSVAVDSAVAVSPVYEDRVQRPSIKKNKLSKLKSKKHPVSKKHKRKPLKKKTVKKQEQDEEPLEEVAMATDSVAMPAYDANDYPYDEEKRITNRVVAKWVEEMAKAAFNKEGNSSIMDNKDFVKSIDQQAIAAAWVSGVDTLMGAYIPKNRYFDSSNFLNGYKTANAKLYLDKKFIRMTTSLTLSNEMAEVYKKIGNRKLNKQFLNYLNEDKMIGYFAYAVDTKAYLQEYPKLMTKMYGSLYKDEIDMATDLFSLLLDEEAVSKVVKGDAVFVFNGLAQKEVSYKSYEYNEENFETKEVMKTKKETLPDFLCMISTEDTRLINKLIAYGVKKKAVKDTVGYYELSVPKSPMKLYFTIKNGIIFLGTNAVEMGQIVANRFQQKLSSKHKALLNDHNCAAYFSPKRLSGKIPSGDLNGIAKLEKTNRVLSALGDVYMNSNPIKGNTFSGEVSMDNPSDQPNALKYLFSVIEDNSK